MPLKQIMLGVIVAGAFASGAHAAEEAQNRPEQSQASPKELTALERLKISGVLTCYTTLQGLKLGLLLALIPTAGQLIQAESAGDVSQVIARSPLFKSRFLIYPIIYGVHAVPLGLFGAYTGFVTGLASSALMEAFHQLGFLKKNNKKAEVL